MIIWKEISMEVVEQSEIKHAYKFTDNLKDRIYTCVCECYGASPIAVFDENHKPAMKFRLFYSKTDYEEKTVHIGDYIIFDKEETTVLDVLTEDEFAKKYVDISI